MRNDPQSDPITSPQDTAPEARKKQRAGRSIVGFFVIYALGAFSLYLVILIYGAITGA